MVVMRVCSLSTTALGAFCMKLGLFNLFSERLISFVIFSISLLSRIDSLSLSMKSEKGMSISKSAAIAIAAGGGQVYRCLAK